MDGRVSLARNILGEDHNPSWFGFFFGLGETRDLHLEIVFASCFLNEALCFMVRGAKCVYAQILRLLLLLPLIVMLSLEETPESLVLLLQIFTHLFARRWRSPLPGLTTISSCLFAIFACVISGSWNIMWTHIILSTCLDLSKKRLPALLNFYHLGRAHDVPGSELSFIVALNRHEVFPLGASHSL